MTRLTPSPLLRPIGIGSTERGAFLRATQQVPPLAPARGGQGVSRASDEGIGGESCPTR
jgi:hypothetical protein